MPRYFVTYKKVEGEEVVLRKELLGWFQNEDVAATHAHYLFTEPGVSIVGVAVEGERPEREGWGYGRVFVRGLRIIVAGCLAFFMYENFLEYPIGVFDIPLAQITANKIFSVFRSNGIGILGMVIAWVVAFGRAGR